jgi:protein O-mannosyl-transferase
MRVFFIFAVVVGFLIYSTGLWAPFNLDDPNVIGQINSENPGLLHGRVIGYWSFWLNRQIMLVAGSVLPWAEPFYYRFFNVLIHAAAATALFWLVWELTSRWQLAAVAGALFVIHPIQTQAVTYISQRFEALAAMFMFLSAAAYVHFRRTGSRRWVAATIVFAAAGALTKETTVILPLWLLLIEWVFFEGARLKRYALYMGAAGLVLLVPALSAFRTSTTNLFAWIPWDRYFLTQGPILTKYFGLATWPRRQFLFYDMEPVNGFSWLLAIQWLLVISVLAAGIYLVRRYKLVGFGIISFFILLLPVIVLPLPDLIFEHRLYPAFAGVAMAVAGCVQAINRKTAFVVVGVLAVLLGVKTARRNRDWNDQLSFLELHHAAFPRDPQILARLASYYYVSGYVNKSIEINLEARKYENRLNSYYSQQGHLLTAVNLASAYLAKNNLQAAEAEARRAVAANPNEPFAWRILGHIQVQTRQFTQAEESFKKFAELQPGPEAWDSLRLTADWAGDKETARSAAEKLKIEEDKAKVEQALPAIPKRYRVFAIFGMMLGLLTIFGWAVGTVWTAVRSIYLPKPSSTGVFASESTKIGESVR